MKEIDYIMAPLDLSGECRTGLKTAIYLARKLRVPLELLHVDERIMNDEQEVMLRVNYQDWEKMERKLEAEAGKKMAKWLEEEGGADLPKKPVYTVLGGDPAETIVNHAEKMGDCLVVLTKKRNSTVTELLLGSVTQKVIRKATVPVVAVHCK
ncbi:MAG: universal stress protein [Deltaproteobacteria bacterium]|nr:universal stress protein [Deltaproteobacteria bacterium]